MAVHDTSSDDTATPGGIQSVDRAITVLEILARDGDAGVGEIAEEMGVHKSTASRLLSALDSRGMVEQEQGRGRYRLGFTVLRLASSIPARLSLTKEARPVIEDLAAGLRETVNLAVLREGYAVNIDQAQGPSAIAMWDWIGNLTPLHATSSGKVLLAGLDPVRRAEELGSGRLERFTPRTTTVRAELERELDAIRGQGYAAVSEEWEQGLNAVAVPVLDHRGHTVAAVSVSGPAFRFDPGDPGLRERLLEAGRAISARMGYTPPDEPGEPGGPA